MCGRVKTCLTACLCGLDLLNQMKVLDELLESPGPERRADVSVLPGFCPVLRLAPTTKTNAVHSLSSLTGTVTPDPDLDP